MPPAPSVGQLTAHTTSKRDRFGGHGRPCSTQGHGRPAPPRLRTGWRHSGGGPLAGRPGKPGGHDRGAESAADAPRLAAHGLRHQRQVRGNRRHGIRRLRTPQFRAVTATACSPSSSRSMTRPCGFGEPVAAHDRWQGLPDGGHPVAGMVAPVPDRAAAAASRASNRAVSPRVEASAPLECVTSMRHRMAK